jgi:enoyl-CoA hydratase
MSKVVRNDTKDHVTVVAIDRPKALNALDMETLKALDEAFAAAEADEDSRVIIITGAGPKAFVAGGDISDLNSRQGLPHYLELAERFHEVLKRIERSDKPTIAAVNGYTLGGGLELMLCTDLRIAARSASFGVPEINIGLFPGAGGSQRLIRQISPCISADEALALGLLNRVVPDEALMSETLALAHTIVGKSPLVLKLLKRAVADGAEMPLSAALRHEQAMISLVFDSADAHEGMSAFLEKRQPKFRGA